MFKDKKSQLSFSINFYLWMLIICTVIPLLCFLAYPVTATSLSEWERKERETEDIAETLVETLDMEYAKLKASFIILRDTSSLQERDFAAFYRDAKEFVRHNGTHVVLIDAKGQQIVQTHSSWGERLPKTNNPSALATVLRTGEPMVTDAFLAAYTQELRASLFVPVFIDGIPQYALSATWSLDDINKLVQKARLPSSVNAAIVDGNGIVLWSKGNPEWIGQPAPLSVLGRLQDGRAHKVLLSSSEGTLVMFSHPLGMANWTVVVTVPQSELIAPFRRSIILLSAAGATVLLLSLLVGTFISRKIRNAVSAVGEEAMRAGKGEEPRPLQVQIAELQNMYDGIAEASRQRKVAEKANEAKAIFLANMSHEIRTPMNAILGLAHLLNQTSLDIEQQNYVKKIGVSGSSLLGILNDILDISRMEAQRLQIESIEFRLDDVMDALATVMSLEGAKKRLEPVISIDSSVPRLLKGDPSRLQQVLINLAGNAIKFTDAGEVVIRVELANSEGGRATVRFTVRDTGIGIPEEAQAKLFQPFSQADSSTTRRFGGTGLGLVISKRLVELMEGTIGMTSTEGRGSEFWFTIPFELGQMAESDDLLQELRNLSVLVVDDDPIARLAIADMVKAIGWQCAAVESGEKAIIECLQANAIRYDVMLIDWQMPGLDGVATGHRVREDSTLQQPILIMMTAYDWENRPKSTHADLFDAVLVKPVTSSSLFDAVRQARARHEDDSTPSSQRAAHDGIWPHRSGTLRLSGIGILLVEDNSINQEVARKILEHEGATVTVVENGQDAVSLLGKKKDAFHIVLMDVQMPVLGGIAATKVIRDVLNLHSMPIIALTAGALAGERDSCLKAGMDDFIAKPFEIENLIATILKYARPSKIATAAEAGKSGDVSMTGLPEATGLDIVQAYGRLGGDHSLLINLLQMLLDQFGSVAAEIRAEMDSKNHEKLLRRLHTLKGTAGNIAAVEVAQLASSLEAKIRSGSLEKADEHLLQLDMAFDKLRQVLADMRYNDRKPHSKESRATLEELLLSLEMHKLLALDQFQSLRGTISDLYGQESCQKLEQIIENLDFAEAVSLLKEMKAPETEGPVKGVF